MDNKNTKVAVIGGGVIGLYISWKLAEKGYDVSVFDRKKEEALGKKCCSTLVSERINKFIPITEDCIENVIDSCLIHFPKKAVRLDFSPKHLALDRGKVIAILLGLNEKAGTKIILGEDIREIPQGFDRVIGCDGAMSMIRKRLELKNPKMKMGIQFFKKEKSDSNITETFLTSSGFCWQIPKGERIECGALGDLNRAKKDMEKRFGENQEIFVALIPQPYFSLDGGLIIPDDEKVTLCGDAMGLTKPWSGGGIIWGLYAADILVRTFPDFKGYKREIQRFFRFKTMKGIISNKAVHILGRYFPYVIPSRIKYDNDFPSIFGCF